MAAKLSEGDTVGMTGEHTGIRVQVVTLPIFNKVHAMQILA